MAAKHGTAWTTRQTAYLRRHCGRSTVAEIAAAIGKTPAAVKSRASKLGLSVSGRRFWTVAEDAQLRREWSQRTAQEIGRDLDRTVSSVYQRADRLGLFVRRDPADKARVEAAIRKYHPRGWTDSDIAGVAGCTREWVKDCRRGLGLPANRGSEHYRDKVRRKTREQLAAKGLRSLAELRREAFRQRARAAGWPDDLRPRSVQILNTLWDNGPMTRREIAQAIGARTDYSGPHAQRKILKSNDPEGSYLAHLLARGLILMLPRAKTIHGQGKGRSQHVYMLAFDVSRGPVTSNDGEAA